MLFITDVHSLGLKTAQGLTFTESFYWDLNDKTREWSKRFAKASPKNAMPSMTVAGNYAACCIISRRWKRSAAIRMTAPRSSPR